MNIKVSVIIPVYNMAVYLTECLDSIVRQTLKDIEIIAIDDGSTDESLKILKEYQKKYKNIVVLIQTNQGQAIAKNNGIKRAKGKYIIIMDPDDWYPHDDCLETLYKTAEEKNASICGGIIIQNAFGIRTLYNEKMAKNFFCNRMVKIKEYPYMYGQTQFLFRRKLLLDNNIFFPPYRRFEDPPFTLKAMISAGGFYGIDQEVYEYRVGHKTITYSLEYCIDILRGFRDMFQMAKDFNLTKLYQGSLESEYKSGAGLLMIKYKYSFCGNEAIDRTIDEINSIIDSWPIAGKELILAREDVLEYREYWKPYIREYTRIKTSLLENKIVIIYGTGKIGKQFIEVYREYMDNVFGFAITKKELSERSQYIRNYEIKQIEEYLDYKDNACVIIATNEKNQKEIEPYLKRLGFQDIIKVDISKVNLAFYNIEKCWFL